MKKVINKRKIKKAKTLEKKLIHRKYRVCPFVKVTKDMKKPKQKKYNQVIRNILKNRKNIESTVGCFQLAVIKIPWYRKMARSFFGFFGYYE